MEQTLSEPKKPLIEEQEAGSPMNSNPMIQPSGNRPAITNPYEYKFEIDKVRINKQHELGVIHDEDSSVRTDNFCKIMAMNAVKAVSDPTSGTTDMSIYIRRIRR